MAGMRPFVDLGTGSFSYLAWSQITNEAAVAHYMSGGRLPVPVTFHLLHGVQSAFQTLGLKNSRFAPAIRILGFATATVILAGNLIIVIGVWAGLAPPLYPKA